MNYMEAKYGEDGKEFFLHYGDFFLELDNVHGKLEKVVEDPKFKVEFKY